MLESEILVKNRFCSKNKTSKFLVKNRLCPRITTLVKNLWKKKEILIINLGQKYNFWRENFGQKSIYFFIFQLLIITFNYNNLIIFSKPDENSKVDARNGTNIVYWIKKNKTLLNYNYY